MLINSAFVKPNTEQTKNETDLTDNDFTSFISPRAQKIAREREKRQTNAVLVDDQLSIYDEVD